MHHTDILNRLVDAYGYQSYMEIGVQRRANNFDKIKVEDKVGVDPDPAAGVWVGTSDEWFKNNHRLFDLIFIDGLHEYKQVFKDIMNSLGCLTEYGTIVVHDCNPTDEPMQRVPRETKVWTGDAWKAFVQIRQYEHLRMYVMNTDFGVGIIQKRPQPLRIPEDMLTYENLDKYRDVWLNLIEPSEWLQKLPTTDKTLTMERQLTFANICSYLETRVPFRYIRIGDGEIQAVLQNKPTGANTDGHRYFYDMGVAIHSVLSRENWHQTHYVGLQNLGSGLFPEFKKRYRYIDWTDNALLHRASIKGQFPQFMKALEGREVIIVGPKHLEKVRGFESVTDNWHHIVVPDKDAWLVHKEVLVLLLKATDIGDDKVILFSCGMMTPVLVHLLSISRPFLTMIHAGSVFDPYCGVQSRSYHKDLKV
jgi:hypothetical protein